MENSKIEWCHHTQNLWWGCTEVHAGCDHCYAAATSNRWGNDLWGNDKPRKYIASWIKNLASFQQKAKGKGEVHRVFVGSMMDIFEKPMPLVKADGSAMAETTADIRFEFFKSIDLGYYPNLDFLLLTKRPSNINKYIPEHWKSNPPKNVMFGTSPVDQATYKTLIPQLLKVNGRRFLSMEPQLDRIGIGVEAPWKGVDWIIQGGESGPNRRPFKLAWAYDMQTMCEVFGIPYFFKQIDKVTPIPEDLLIRQFPAQPQIQAL